jgi:hypothetical protein
MVRNGSNIDRLAELIWLTFLQKRNRRYCRNTRTCGTAHPDCTNIMRS